MDIGVLHRLNSEKEHTRLLCGTSTERMSPGDKELLGENVDCRTHESRGKVEFMTETTNGYVSWANRFASANVFQPLLFGAAAL